MQIPFHVFCLLLHLVSRISILKKLSGHELALMQLPFHVFCLLLHLVSRISILPEIKWIWTCSNASPIPRFCTFLHLWRCRFHQSSGGHEDAVDRVNFDWSRKITYQLSIGWIAVPVAAQVLAKRTYAFPAISRAAVAGRQSPLQQPVNELDLPVS